MFAYVLLLNLHVPCLVYQVDDSYKVGDLVLTPLRNIMQIGIIVKIFYLYNYLSFANEKILLSQDIINLFNKKSNNLENCKIEEDFYKLLIKLDKVNNYVINFSDQNLSIIDKKNNINNRLDFSIKLDATINKPEIFIDFKKIKTVNCKILSLNKEELQIIYFLQKHYLISYEDYIKTKYYFHCDKKYSYKKDIQKEYEYKHNIASIVCLHKINLLPLSQEQMNCFASISTVRKPSLVYGVTGSGKTEVYFYYIKQILEQDSKAQILILLPEITLISQLLNRFKERFGFEADIWHSCISKAKKKQLYYKIFLGNTAVVIGTRSSIFLPFTNLALVIMDEEHDDSYKQEDQMLYDAKNILEIFYTVRQNIKICLFSATPSLNSLLKVKLEKYSFAKILSRHLNIPLPNIIIIDMNKKQNAKLQNHHNILQGSKNTANELKLNEAKQNNEPLNNIAQDLSATNKPKSLDVNIITESSLKETHNKLKHSIISKELYDAILEHLNNGNQIMLYCNKRGYYRIIYCKNCNIKVECTDCSAALIFHKEKNLFICHHCGYSVLQYLNCNICKTELSMHSLGIEKLKSIIKEEFQSARVILISSDTMSTEEQIEKNIQTIKEKKCDIIIATQILAKGHHFPFVNLVGILDIDSSIKSIDLYAFEKNFQILSQVSGRAGRVTKGIVYIQSFLPSHPLIQSVVENDFIKFAKLEMKYRSDLKMPPFTRALCITIISIDPILCKEFALGANAILLDFNIKHNNKLKILGPTACLIAKLKRKYRYKIIVIADVNFNFFNLKIKLESALQNKNIAFKFELEPKSFF